MTGFIVFISLSLVLLLGITAYNWATAPRLLATSSFAPTPASPRVSICIPARNEAARITATIVAACGSNYPNFEVLIANDCSTDGTDLLLAQLAKQWPIKVSTITTLPAGWLGKPHACHHLGALAKGDILLFIDADVVLKPGALNQLVSLFDTSKAAAISLFPKQECQSFAERLIVPMMDFLVYTTLPIALANRFQLPGLTAATGQFFALRSAAYEAVGGHAAVAAEILEDMALARILKREGQPLILGIGNEGVTTRMYTSRAEVVNGFAKNLFTAFGKNQVFFGVAVGTFALTFLAPLVLSVFNTYWLIPLGLGWALRILHAAAFKHSVWIAIFCWPLSALGVVIIALISWYHSDAGKLQWRGRPLSPLSNNS